MKKLRSFKCLFCRNHLPFNWLAQLLRKRKVGRRSLTKIWHRSALAESVNVSIGGATELGTLVYQRLQQTLSHTQETARSGRLGLRTRLQFSPWSTSALLLEEYFSWASTFPEVLEAFQSVQNWISVDLSGKSRLCSIYSIIGLFWHSDHARLMNRESTWITLRLRCSVILEIAVRLRMM
jgi:hypothetical protein